MVSCVKMAYSTSAIDAESEIVGDIFCEFPPVSGRLVNRIHENINSILFNFMTVLLIIIVLHSPKIGQQIMEGLMIKIWCRVLSVES